MAGLVGSGVGFDSIGVRDALAQICFENLMGTVDERIYFKDTDSRFIMVSQGYIDNLAPGMTVADIIGKTDFDLFGGQHARDALEDERHIISTGRPLINKVETETFQGERPDYCVSTSKFPLRNRDGRIVGTFGLSRDVTAQVAAEKVLAYRALHDPMTGLANRTVLMDRISQALLRLDRHPGRVAILFVDLDRFKAVNDTSGHEAGDQVLIRAASCLSKAARRSDTVARLGGDEFVVLCSPLRSRDNPQAIGERLIRAIRKPYVDADRNLSVTTSVGVAVTSDPAADPGQLLADADVAMYQAKKLGGNRAQMFMPAQRTQAQVGRQLDLELRRAIQQHQLHLVYQPVFRLQDHSLCGVEALVRWDHPTMGNIPPSEFIPVAEDRGMIAQIDAFTLNEACQQLATWTASGTIPRDFVMAVNISGRHLTDPQLAERVRQTVTAHQVNPALLRLELTETALVGELSDIRGALVQLSKLGVSIALDDFGTGYSTLTHLQQLEVDVLKIDRSFIEQICRSPRDREIVAAIVAMSHAMGITVVGEGVETYGQLKALQDLRCDEGQGYLLARPQPPGIITQLTQPALHSMVANSQRPQTARAAGTRASSKVSRDRQTHKTGRTACYNGAQLV